MNSALLFLERVGNIKRHIFLLHRSGVGNFFLTAYRLKNKTFADRPSKKQKQKKTQMFSNKNLSH